MRDADDDELLELLARALHGAEPVPDVLHDAALASFGFRDPDAALAQLETEVLVATRDDDSGPLVFEAPHVEISVTVDDGRIVGQLAPPIACSGAVESTKASAVPFRVDDLGRFAVDAPAGPVRLVVEHPAGRVRTDWFHA